MARIVACVLAAIAVTTLWTNKSSGASITWSATASTTGWVTGSNWEGGVDPVNNLTTDVAVFNQTTYLNVPNVSARSVGGIVIGDGTTATAAMPLGTGVNQNRLVIGGSGITMNANAGSFTTGTSGGQGILLGANQTWTNNSSNALTVRWVGNANGTDTSTPYLVTVAGTGAGGVLISTGVLSGTSTSASAGSAVGFIVDGGRLTLNAANIIDGGVNLNSGSLLLANNGALGSGTLTINGGRLAVTTLSGTGSVIRTTAASVVFNADFTAGEVRGTALVGLQLSLDGAMTLTGNRTITVDSGAGFNLYGGVSDGGNGYGITKNGTALMRLAGANTYTGDTRVDGGTLTIFSNLAAQFSALDTNGGGTFVVAAASPTIGGLKGSKNPTINAGVVSISLNPAAGVSNTYSGVLSGTTSIIKINGGTQVFSGANTYTGATDIRSGTLQIGNAGTTGALSLASAITGSAGGTLAFNRVNTVTQGTDFNSVISGGISVAQLGSGTLILNGVNTYSGGTWINAGILRAGGTSAFGSGAITLASGATLDLNNLEIANTITSSGGTILNAASFTGTTQLTSGSTTLSSIGGTVDIDASAVADLSGTIDAMVIVKDGGRGRAAGQIRKNVAVNAGAHFDILDGASIDEGASFTFANNGQIHVDRANNLTLSKAITGAGGLRKSNTGNLILTGSHSYSGNTLIEQGAFAVNGALTGSGTVTINPNAILMGSGTISGPTIVDGIHSPGNSPGLETFTNGLMYGASSVLVWELSANTDSLADRGTLYDGIDLTGGALNVTSGAAVNLVFNAALASGSASVVNWSDAFWAVSRTWKILDVGTAATWNEGTFSLGSVGLDASGVSLASVRGDASFNVSHDQDGSVYVNYVIVPEPGTVIFAGIGIAMLWAGAAARGRRRA